jgi:hypothetical protein
VLSDNQTSPKDAQGDANPTDQQGQNPEQPKSKSTHSGNKYAEPGANTYCCCPKSNQRGWLDYVGVLFIGLGFLASACAAGFSAWQALVARQTLHQSQRPWVIVETAVLSRPIDLKAGTLNVAVEFGVKNFGVSVATDGWSLGAVVIDARNWNEACNQLDTYRRASTEAQRKNQIAGWPVGFVLAPLQDHKIPMTIGKPELSVSTVVDSFNRGATNFYVLGCIEYKDQFRIRHTTRACFVPTARIGDDGMVGFKACDAMQTAD